MVLDRNAGKIALHKITDASWGGALASANVTVNDSTAYTVKVIVKQRHVSAWVVGQASATISYDSSALLGTGQSGFWADKTSVTFDDCQIFDGNWRDPLVPRFHGLADASISSGELLVTGSTRGNLPLVPLPSSRASQPAQIRAGLAHFPPGGLAPEYPRLALCLRLGYFRTWCLPFRVGPQRHDGK